ncbi:MAG: ABC transporter permease [Pseudomonadota bacterium]
MNGAPSLDYADLAMASLLLLLVGGLSTALSLGLARTLAVSAIRMGAQLALLALILQWLFAAQTPWITFGAMVVMAGFAGLEVLNRQSRPAGRIWTGAVGSGAMLAGGTIVVLPALILVVEAEPWYAPRVALPLFGMVAGSAMTGVALGLDTMAQGVMREAAAIEARLALGATRLQALAGPGRNAIRTGLMPTINAMAAMGVVTIPGMMTGQLLAGADPVQAAKMQALVMFLIGGVSALGTIGAVFALAYRVTDDRHRLRLDRLRD